MKFNELSLRMFKSSIRRYKLYFLCSSFNTMVLFLYLTMYTNKDFNDPYKVDPFISSNVFAPTVILCIFSACFIAYAHNYFVKLRKKDFALFMILGMTENNIRKIITLENMLISVISILVGLILGTCFSKLFYMIILKITDIKIDFSINLKSYLYATIFLGLINLIMILKSCIFVPMHQIINLLKAEKTSDKNFFGKPVFGVIGFVIIVSQCIGAINKKFLLPISISLVISIISLYLIVSNLHWIILKLKRSKSFRNMMWIKNLKYTIGSSKKIIFSITLLVTVIIYFISYVSTASESVYKNAIIKNPYDLVYGEIFNKNKISEDRLNDLLKSNDTKVESLESLEIIVQRPIVIISAKSLNNISGLNLNVEKGKYICLIQINRNDGYSHNEQELKTYNINNTTYTSQEKIEKMLVNNITMLNGSYYLIFNDDDYKAIKASVNPIFIGNIRLINFDDWTKTETIVNNLTNELLNYNKTNTEQFFDNTNEDIREFKPVSKITAYKLAEEFNKFSIFLLCFVFFLFFMASNLMIHFKLLTEFEQEKVKYEKLSKIGVLEKEISISISKELSIIFLLPCILGMYLGIYCIYLNIVSIGISGSHEIKYALITGGMYSLLELVVYMFYKNYYVKKLLS